MQEEGAATQHKIGKGKRKKETKKEKNKEKFSILSCNQFRNESNYEST